MCIMFSVVIPAYNCADVIEDAINSVCKQSVKEYIGEIIVIMMDQQMIHLMC